MFFIEDSIAVTRRIFIAGVCSAALPAGGTPLEVAYAGSMASVMEGPLKRKAAAELGMALAGRAQGASGLAQLIVSRSIRPDVFISVTPSPMVIVLGAGLAARAAAIARTEMAIAYSPRSRWAGEFRSRPWWRVLEEPGLRFGRTDPLTDPQGRNMVFVMQLAERFYGQPGLARRVLGPDVNARQIFSEPSVEARLQSGELDAASSYKIQPLAFHLPFVTLPEEVNLGSTRRAAEYEQARLTLGGRTFHPEPLVYYAAPLKEAAHPVEAARFAGWLRGDSAQEIFRSAGYDPPEGAGELRGS